MCGLHLEPSYSRALESILDLYYSLPVIIDKINCPAARARNTSKLDAGFRKNLKQVPSFIFLFFWKLGCFFPGCSTQREMIRNTHHVL